jgi:DNA polymerase-3 subunit gamma/tau
VEPQSAKPKQTPSLFRKKEAVTQEESEEKREKLSETFDADSVKNAWDEFTAYRLSLNMGDAEKLVLSRTLIKHGERDVVIRLGSQLEVSILEKFESDLVQFLRQQLSNDFLLLKKEVQEHKETNKLYTSKDKFDFMAEQNPALKDLKERLGLDFEY